MEYGHESYLQRVVPEHNGMFPAEAATTATATIHQPSLQRQLQQQHEQCLRRTHHSGVIPLVRRFSRSRSRRRGCSRIGRPASRISQPAPALSPQLSRMFRTTQKKKVEHGDVEPRCKLLPEILQLDNRKTFDPKPSLSVGNGCGLCECLA